VTERENQVESADESSGAGVAVALSALTLAACGGGGGGSTPPPTQNPPPVIPPPVVITDAEAARFLLQAQFAVTDADLTAVKANGYASWLTTGSTKTSSD